MSQSTACMLCCLIDRELASVGALHAAITRSCFVHQESEWAITSEKYVGGTHPLPKGACASGSACGPNRILGARARRQCLRGTTKPSSVHLIQLVASGKFICEPAVRHRDLVVILETRPRLIVQPWDRLIHAAVPGRSARASGLPAYCHQFRRWCGGWGIASGGWL